MTDVPQPAEIVRLLDELRAGSSRARRHAARLLGTVTPPEPVVTQALIERLGDSNVKVRAVVVDALARNGRFIVPALIEAWPNARPDTRKAFAATLGRIGPAAGSALPLLTEALDDPFLAHTASEAIGRIRGSGWLRWIIGFDKCGPWVLFSAGLFALGTEFLNVAKLLVDRQPAARIALFYGLLFGSLGGLLGSRLKGWKGARLFAEVLTPVGIAIGLFIGTLAAAAFDPLLGALRSP